MNSQSDLPLDEASIISGGATPRRSVRVFLIWLVLACLLPGIIGAGLLFFQEYQDGRAQLEKDTLQTARALVQAVDNQILRVEALAQGLATSASLLHGDLGRFHQQAGETLKRAKLGVNVVLVDRTGQQILNTLKEFGEPLPANNNPELFRQVFETGRPVVSNLYIGRVTKRPIMTVAVPVFVNGETLYVLIIPILPSQYEEILTAQNLPSPWIVAVLDGTGTIVARTQRGEETLGQKVSSDFLRRYLEANEGTMETVSEDGIPVMSVFARSPFTQWGVGVGIPRENLEVELTRTLSVLAVGIFCLFGLGLGLAWVLGGRISRSFQAIMAPAVSLGAGETVKLPSVDVMEAAEVTKAIGEAAGLLRERQLALLASEEKYRTLFSNMAEGFAFGELQYDGYGKPVDIVLLEANDAFYEQTGLSKDILGRPAREYLPGLEKYWLDAYFSAVVTGQSVRLENFNSDTRRYYDLCAFSPTPGRFAMVFRDVTDQKRVEKSLQESEANLRQLISTLPGMVWTSDPKGAVDFLSQRWYDYTGTTEESQLGAGVFECIHPEDREAVLLDWQTAVADRSGLHLEYRLRRHDGKYRWFKSRGTPILDSAGNVIRWLGVITDIHDLKRTQEALLDSVRRYKALFNNKTSAIAHLRIVTDDQGNPIDYVIDAVNDTYERITGLRNDEVIGKRATEVFPGIQEFEFDFIGEFGRIGLGGEEGSFEVYFPLTGQWLSLYAYSPKPGEVILIFTDISAQKEAEQHLALERELLSGIIDNIPVMLCLHDAKMGQFRLNHHLQEVLGWTTEDAKAGDFMAKLYPDPGYRAVVGEFMESLAPGWREFDTVTKDGRVIPCEWANVRLSNDRVISIGIDLQERRHAQARLEVNAERQALLLEVASGILHAWGDKTEMAKVLFEKVRTHLEADVCFNYRLLPDGQGMELVAGLGVSDEVRSELRHLAIGETFCGAVAANGRCLMADRERIDNDELDQFVRDLGMRAYMVHPLMGLEGQVIGTLSLGSTRRDSYDHEEMDFLQTIAYFLALAWERRRAEQKILMLNADLERRVDERTAELMAANRELEAFTFATSHDLKGPLGRINSFSTLLERGYRGKLEGDGLVFLDFIRKNATRLMLLVDDLMSHARVTQQALELQPVDMLALTQVVLQENAVEIREASAHIQLDLPPAKVLGDLHALTQVLVNLLQNGLKYSEPGRPPVIEIGGQEREGRFRCWVRDNGIGFDMAYHDKIFEMFRRLHTYSEYEGSGIGLALVKRAMERMGGTVWAESQPGQGATFFLELPLASAKVRVPAEPADPLR